MSLRPNMNWAASENKTGLEVIFYQVEIQLQKRPLHMQPLLLFANSTNTRNGQGNSVQDY